MKEDRDHGRQGIDTKVNGNNQYHITFGIKGVMREGTPMGSLTQFAIEVYVDPLPKAVEEEKKKQQHL